MKFCKQKNKYSCGPIAIINIAKHLGLNLTYKKHYYLIKTLCKCDKTGTSIEDFENTLKILPVKINQPTNINKINIVITNKHAFIITNETDNYFKVQNYSNPKIKLLSKESLQSLLNDSTTIAYQVEKINK